MFLMYILLYFIIFSIYIFLPWKSLFNAHVASFLCPLCLYPLHTHVFSCVYLLCVSHLVSRLLYLYFWCICPFRLHVSSCVYPIYVYHFIYRLFYIYVVLYISCSIYILCYIYVSPCAYFFDIHDFFVYMFPHIYVFTN